MSEKTRAILAELTLEEKCELCAQADGSFGRIPRMDLPGSVPQDNPRGGADYFRSGRPVEGDEQYHPVAFPSDACLAMSWDEKLAKETGAHFAEECRANPTLVNWLFRPGVNIKRSYLCGRNFEYFSEDPVLAGEMAGSYIQGLQENGVAATLKHFVCNNQEFERMTTNSVVSERALQEVYQRPFEIAIKKGHPLSVMSSYNQVNGEWVNSNQHICNLLRKQIGFDGVVVSDFAAIHRNKVAAHNAGMMDIELAPVSIHSAELLEAVRDGRVKEETLDAGLERVLDLVDQLYATTPVEADMEELHEEARRAAEQCIVLLQNDGTLPLAEKQERLLVVGRLAENPSYMGGGSGHMNGYRIDTYLDAIRALVPDAAYAPGYLLVEDFPPKEPADPALIREAVEAAKQAETVIVFAGLGYCYESEGYDRDNIQLPEGQRELLDALMQVDARIILVLSCGSVLDISRWTDRVSAVVYNSLGGESVAPATVNVLFGKTEPGGRLAGTWPVCEEHGPTYINFTGACQDMQDVVYGEGIYVGYRWYEKRKLPVLYPFGHGLSYTSFEIGKPVLSTRNLTPEGQLTVTVPVTNTGDRTGSQVIQLYLSHIEGSICDHPVKELKAFAKVTLAPGETREAVMTLKRRNFEFFAPAQDTWILEDGAYTLHIGTSAAEKDIRYNELVMVSGGDKPFIYTEMTPLAWFIASEKYHKILQENLPPEVDQMMNQDTFEWCCLCVPLPYYKVTEPFLGAPMMTPEQAEFVLKKMNE
ncbi:MAG: glycoside hydrolase family 3 C-terminal domain-containing protein [Lachnospiraceae bacterium]|nr:glycoside hydrolase family 3 C-terminal domain-containing protein [Lachnospiraceae bacterium]